MKPNPLHSLRVRLVLLVLDGKDDLNDPPQESEQRKWNRHVENDAGEEKRNGDEKDDQADDDFDDAGFANLPAELRANLENQLAGLELFQPLGPQRLHDLIHLAMIAQHPNNFTKQLPADFGGHRKSRKKVVVTGPQAVHPPRRL